jgi:hypothetical protein
MIYAQEREIARAVGAKAIGILITNTIPYKNVHRTNFEQEYELVRGTNREGALFVSHQQPASQGTATYICHFWKRQIE